jgi:uncharacterized protein (DUF2252 family)
MIFDINDFDETAPGPWEWDLKRLAVSFEIAGRNAGFAESDRRASTLAVTRAYRETIRAEAASPVLTAWYQHLDIDHVLEWIRSEKKAHRADERQVKVAEAVVAKARTKDSAQAVDKLVGMIDGKLRILPDSPLVVPIDDLVPPGAARDADVLAMRQLIDSYQKTLHYDHHPIEEFSYVHMARKVVGVGSVGTRAWIVLLQGRDETDPLLLQRLLCWNDSPARASTPPTVSAWSRANA